VTTLTSAGAYQNFGGSYLLHLQGAAVCFSETPLTTQQTIRRQMQKYCILNVYCYENLRFRTRISVADFSGVMTVFVFGVLAPLHVLRLL